MTTTTQQNNDSKNLALQKVEKMKVAINEDFVQNQLRAIFADNSAGFAASIIDLFSGDKQLMECDPKMVIMQALKAATLKLPVVKSLGYAWIVAYKGVPQFQIGYKGLIQLAIRSAEYRTIHTDVVYEGEYRSTNKLTGEFDFSGTATSNVVVGYFAHFELKNGFAKTLYMTKEKVTAHAKKYSKSYAFQGSPWQTEFDSMALKTVLSNLLRKWGYLSVEMANVISSDEDHDAADKVLDEVRNNGNSKDVDLTEHTEVGSKINGTQTSAPF